MMGKFYNTKLKKKNIYIIQFSFRILLGAYWYRSSSHIKRRGEENEELDMKTNSWCFYFVFLLHFVSSVSKIKVREDILSAADSLLERKHRLL